MVLSRALLHALGSLATLATAGVLACASTSPARLVASPWTVTAIEGDPVATFRNGEPPSLVFEEEGRRVSGSTGCNRLNGTYRVDGERLSFSPLGITKRACPGEAMEVERAFLRALGAVASHRLGDGTLDLLDADGHAVVRLVASPPETPPR